MPRTSRVSGRSWDHLLARADFLRVAASGMRCVTTGFILQAAARESDQSGPVRVGFTASRKVGNAVARNRAKRRLRALSDLVMAGGDPNLDYVLVARAEAITRNFAGMEMDLRQALTKVARKTKAAPQ